MNRKLLSLVLPALVLVISAEILYRRIFVEQVAPQFSPLFVYGLIGLNLVYCGREFRRFMGLKSREAKKC